MKIILLEDVKTKGKKGDIIEVSDGYARNFLLPRKLAKIADEQSIREIEAQNEAAAHRREIEKEKAEEQKLEIEKTVLEIPAAGSEERLFGAITNKDIAEYLENKTKIEIDRKKFAIDPIKTYGEYTVNIKLFAEVSAKLRVKIVPEQS